MSMSLSMPSSMSVDLQQAGIEFMPIDETASMAEEATTAEPSYYPTVSLVLFFKKANDLYKLTLLHFPILVPAYFVSHRNVSYRCKFILFA
jgi:hypothetical protein